MKKLIPFLGSLLCASSLFAGVIDRVETLTVSAVTNAAATAASTATTTLRYDGHVDKIVLDMVTGYASPTCTVDIVTVATNDLGTTAQTLLSLTATGDGTYFPRELADTTAGVDITGAAEAIALYKDKIQLKVYNANVTNSISVSAYIILK